MEGIKKMTDLKYKIIGSSETAKILHKRLLKNSDYELIIDLDKLMILEETLKNETH
jgi:hypothetical protein